MNKGIADRAAGYAFLRLNVTSIVPDNHGEPDDFLRYILWFVYHQGRDVLNTAVVTQKQSADFTEMPFLPFIIKNTILLEQSTS